MVDDNPQDLIHDVVAEAVFGGHPIGRPVIGRAEVISSVSKKALDRVSPGGVRGRQHRRRGGRQRHARPRRRAAQHPAACDRVERAPRPEAVRSRAAARLPLPAEGDRAVPRLPRRAGHLAARRAPLRRLAARLDPRRLRVVPALPGDPREARAWPTRSTASPPSTPTRARSASTSARARRTSSTCFEIVARELADVAAGNVRPGELERAQENLKGRMLLSLESTSNRMSRLGKSLITDTELLSLDELVARIEAVTADDVAELAADLLRLDRLSAAGIGPVRGALPRRDRAGQPGSRRAGGGVKVILFGRRRQGRLRARARARGRRARARRVDPRRGRGRRLHPARGGRGERPRRARGPASRSSSGRPASTRSAWRRSRACTSCRSSTRRTSRSAPC